METNTYTQPTGMLSGQPQQQQGYSGEVDVAGSKVTVSNGVAEYDGKKYYVSNNGEMVLDENRRLVAQITDGKVVAPSKQLIEMLREKGWIE